MNFTKKELKTLEIDVTKTGFTVWIKELHEGKIRRHWLLDGSCIKEDGMVRITNPNIWKFNAKYFPVENTIHLIKNV